MTIQQVTALYLESIRLAQTATSIEDYRHALETAKQATAVAEVGSHPYINCLANVASISADFGDYRTALSAGEEAVALLPLHPAAASVAPYVWFAMGRAYSRLGKHVAAIRHLRQALSCAEGELAERIRLTLARTYARSERIAEAWQVLHGIANTTFPGKYHAAAALIHAKAFHWSAAYTEARTALSMFDAESKVFDAVEYAELLLTLKVAARAMGRNEEAQVWFGKFENLLSRMAVGLVTILLSNWRQIGGEVFEEARCSCGPVGHRRCGLRGVCG